MTENFHKFQLDALVGIGGDGTLSIAPDDVVVDLENRSVPPDFDLVRTARAMGITFGDGIATKC